jgi:hypothetical protein
MMKKILSAGLFLSSLSLSAQIDLGMPTATGKGGASTAILRNWDVIGINPANLGWRDNYLLSVGVLNFGVTAQSEAFQSKTLRDALLHPNDPFTAADKQFYASQFNSPNALNLQSSLTWGAASFYHPRLGGIAVSVRDRQYAHVGLNKNASDFIFLGQDAPFLSDTNSYNKTLGQLFDSTNVSFLHYRELNIAYGRRIYSGGTEDAEGNPAVQLYLGFGFKYLWGFSSLDAKAENQEMSGHASLSTDYNIDYATINGFTPQESPNVFHANGSGMAFDIGTSLIIRNKWIFGASVTDIGSIDWTNNQLFATDAQMTPPDSSNYGLNSWDVSSQASFAFASNGLFNYGPGEDFSTTLPSKLRLGAGYKTEHFEAGADLVFPLANKDLNLTSPYFGLGAQYNLMGWVKISAGISGNAEMGLSVPFGVVAGIAEVVEIGVATGDVLTFVDKSKNPYLSVAVITLRFNVKPFKKANALPAS